MRDQNETLHLNGMAFRIAQSPGELQAAGGGSWDYPHHWNDDPLAAITDAWPQLLGVVFETGGAMFLDSLGDGVYQMGGSFADEDQDQALKFRAMVMLAFCGTDCRRLLVTAPRPEHVELGKLFWLYEYGRRTVETEDGSRTTHHLSADVDEWAARFGFPAFHVESRRFGQEEKALAIITRWACHSGDFGALDFSYLDTVDPAHWRVDVAQNEAIRGGFQWTEGATHWIEHDASCGVPRGDRVCTCAPVIGFTNGHETATVGPGGSVSIAAMH